MAIVRRLLIFTLSTLLAAPAWAKPMALVRGATKVVPIHKRNGVAQGGRSSTMVLSDAPKHIDKKPSDKVVKAAKPDDKIAHPQSTASRPTPDAKRGDKSVADKADKKGAPKASPAATLVAINTHETFALRPDGKGRFDGKTLKAFANFLRCHHTGRKHAIAPRLLQLLYATAKQFDFQRIVVVAGYRAPKVAREKGNPKSPHKQGVACDFRIEGVANTDLRDFLRDKFDRVGVGYYPNSGFIHLDVRTANAFWIDESGPGERARYTRDTAEALAVERAVGLKGAPSPREEDFDRELAVNTPPAPEVSPAPSKLPAPPPIPAEPSDANDSPPSAPTAAVREPRQAASPTSPPTSKQDWGNSPQGSPGKGGDSGGSPPPANASAR